MRKDVYINLNIKILYYKATYLQYLKLLHNNTNISNIISYINVISYINRTFSQ